jgi:hypothetical protein
VSSTPKQQRYATLSSDSDSEIDLLDCDGHDDSFVDLTKPVSTVSKLFYAHQLC